jgi:hypothetical protein
MPQNRAQVICTEESSLKEEQANLRTKLTRHGNSLKFTNQALSNSQKQYSNNLGITKGTVVLPYIQGQQKKFTRSVKDLEYKWPTYSAMEHTHKNKTKKRHT